MVQCEVVLDDRAALMRVFGECETAGAVSVSACIVMAGQRPIKIGTRGLINLGSS